VLKLAYVQALTRQQEEAVANAAQRGEYEPFVNDLASVRAGLLRRGIEVHPTYSDAALPPLRGLRPDEIFAFGGLQTMWRWLQCFGWQSQMAASYPRPLDRFLNRRTWRGTPGELRDGPARAIKPVFVKTCRPCFPDGARVEAAIWPNIGTLANLQPGLEQEQFLCSEVVSFMAEHRCYVMQGRLLGVHAYQLLGHYCGPVEAAAVEAHMPDVRPHGEPIRDAINLLEASGESLSAYALDFGRLAGGGLALVEMNDAIALTNYGLSSSDYLDLHLARWRELAGRNSRPGVAVQL